MTEDQYVLGHTPRELDRLDLQGEFYRDITRRALESGGLESGMRVLDIGCGSGDVTLLVAELVGPSGSVVGLDRDEPTVLAARARALTRGVHHVAFELGEVDEGSRVGEFDALVGRFVLMHQLDPAGTLAQAVRPVRPGGPVIILESHMAGLLATCHSLPLSPLYDRIIRWKCKVVQAAGADIEAGLRLRRVFMDAGLPEPGVRMESRVDGGPDSPAYRYMAESVRSMLPMAQQLDVHGVTPEDAERLEDDLRDEVVAAGGVLVSWPLVAAWSRVPG